MANLVIDIGNTLIKLAVFDNDELLFTSPYTAIDIETISDLLEKYPVEKAIISSVKKENYEWQAVLKEKTKLIHFNTGMAAGIQSHYLTPHTLGADRLAAVIGATYLYPGSNNLVIDGGTCITYDFVDARGNYFGGSISPGLNMRYNALNYYTAALPLIKVDKAFERGYGNDTSSAIQSGVQNGIKYELTGFITGYTANEGQLNVVLTGGDSIFFDTLLKNSIFAPCIKIEPHLVLKGLNAATKKHND